MTKHKFKQNAQSLQKWPITKMLPITTKIQPNYYLSVASVDSSMIGSTYVFPEKTQQIHKRMCGKYK